MRHVGDVEAIRFWYVVDVGLGPMLLRSTADNPMNFKKWFDVPELEVDVTRMPNLKQALSG